MSKLKKMLLLELGIILLFIITVIVVKYKIFEAFPRCIVNEQLGIQCPSCGATRCVINFVLGNWIESFNYHQVLFVTILYLIFVNFVYIFNCFRNKKVLQWIYPKFYFWIIWTVILIIFTIVRNII